MNITKQILLEWLAQGPTQITFIAPFFISVLGLLLLSSFRTKTTAILFAMAIGLTPISWLLSSWNDAGLHVFPFFFFGFGWLVLTDRLDVKANMFGVLVASYWGMLATDAMGSFTAYESGSYSNRSWYWGIGGYGWEDGLVTMPPVIFLVLIGLQIALRHNRANLALIKHPFDDPQVAAAKC